MQDTDLYRQILGIQDPWTVARVDVSVEKQRVDIFVGHKEGHRWPCPECKKALPVYDHAEERQWRHLDTMQFATYLHARPPRVSCDEHGVKQVSLPWAEPKSRFTAMFERFAIDVMLKTDVTGATRILRLTWDEAWAVKKRAVKRGLLRKKERPVRLLGVDEKAIRKHHRYVTIVCDLERGAVEYVARGRKQESLEGFYKGLSPGILASIEGVAMDMWRPFIAATRACLPEAHNKIVHDRFHLMRYANGAVDTVRKREHRELVAEGDFQLAGSKFLWLYGEENVPQRWQERFEPLKRANLKTARAWAIKEALRALWDCPDQASALAYWKKWFHWATHSRLKPVIAAARTLKNHLHNVMTYFRHRITTALSEGLNSKVRTIQQMAAGFRNDENFRTSIYFHCGRLDLYPSTH